MIPISDDNPARLAPVATWLVIGLCVIVYLWERSLGREMNAAIFVLGFVPASLMMPHAAPNGFVSFPPLATIFTSMFMHGGVLHLAGNMLYLWIFGNNVEDAMGHARFALFYLASGAAAAMTLAVIVPLGIIFYPFTLSAFWVVSFWFVLQLISASFSNPQQPGVAWWAHVGGFAAGLLLTPLFKSRAFPIFGRPRPGPWGR